MDTRVADRSGIIPAMTSAAAIPDCLATTVCPNCGYSLAGLARSGVCPECAREYDQSQIILYGWGRGQHESVATAKKSRLVWVLVASTFWLFAQFFFSAQFWLFGAHGVRNGLILVAIIAAATAFAMFRRSETGHPGQIQIRLSDGGAVQYDNLCGPGELTILLPRRAIGFW